MIWLLLLIPTAAGIAALALRNPAALRRALLLAAAAAHAALTAMCWAVRPEPVLNGWLGLDALALLVPEHHQRASSSRPRSTRSATCAARPRPARPTSRRACLFANAPEARLRRLPAALPGHDDAGDAVSRHLGLLWVGVEATTLASAPLIYFHRHHRSLEATWKYLLICSVGIALALLGNFFLAVAATARRRPTLHLTIDDLHGRTPAARPAAG